MKREYKFTDYLLSELRLVYVTAKRKRDITAGITRLVGHTGWPRQVFWKQAVAMGLAHYSRRPWSAEDLAYLEEKLGKVSVSRIAKALKRSPRAVECRALELGRSRRLRAGYTASDLQQVFGVTPERVRRWMDRGLFGKVHHVAAGHRIAEHNVAQFVRRAHGEYDLRRVDQDWYKAIAFDRQHGGEI